MQVRRQACAIRTCTRTKARCPGNFRRSSVTKLPASSSNAAPASRSSSPATTSFRFSFHIAESARTANRRRQICASRLLRVCVRARAISRSDGKPVTQLWGLGTFAEYTVLPVDTIAKVRDDAPFDPICYIGCGATTGLGAALFAAKIERGSSVIVFGLGGIGLNVVQGARLAGAKTIIGVDTNPGKGIHRAALRRDGIRRPAQGGETHEPPDEADRWRRRLHLRVHRHPAGDAPGVRVHESPHGARATSSASRRTARKCRRSPAI